MWYYINLCRCANVSYSSRAQSLLHLVQLRGEKQFPSAVVLSQFISKQFGKLVWRTSELLQVTLSAKEWMMCGIMPLPDSYTFSKPSAETREGIKLALHCTCLCLAGTQRGAENQVTVCKCTKDKSWFCLSGTFLSWTPCCLSLPAFLFL